MENTITTTTPTKSLSSSLNTQQSVPMNTPRNVPSNDIVSVTGQEEGDDVKAFSEMTDVERQGLQEKLSELLDKLNMDYNPLNFAASFAYDEDIQSLYVEIKRIDTGEVVRQIPSEEAIKLMASLREMQGVIFDVGA